MEKGRCVYSIHTFSIFLVIFQSILQRNAGGPLRGKNMYEIIKLDGLPHTLGCVVVRSATVAGQEQLGFCPFYR